MKLYTTESSHAKWNAQRNLQGRTHYVDDETLRWHKSRILSTYITDSGLLFALIESCAADSNNHKRGFRHVIFDLFGNVVERPTLHDLFSSSKAAHKAMWEKLNSLDAKQITLDAIAHAEQWNAREMAELRNTVATMATKAA